MKRKASHPPHSGNVLVLLANRLAQSVNLDVTSQLSQFLLMQMALAVHEANAAGFTHKDLADMLGVSVKRIESYLRIDQV
jgi:DNA-directed RNA polymerase specialized sigma24 family protein